MQPQGPLFTQIDAQKNLPALPNTLLKLIEACRQDRGDLKELSRIIGSDPSLTSKVLNLVNSAYYALPHRVKDIHQAVVIVGTNAIKNIAICASVYEAFSQIKGNGFDLKSFWWHSLKCGVLAKFIAEKTDYVQPSEAFLSGLLHDIGKLVLGVNFPGQYKVSNISRDQLLAIEKQLGGSHAEVGAWLVRRWNLSSFIADALLYHHEPKERILNALPLVKIVYIANALSHLEQQDEDYQIAKDICGLSRAQVEELLSQADRELEDVAQLLDIEIESPGGPEAIVSEKDREKHGDLVHEVQELSLLTGTLQNLLEASDEDTIVRVAQQGLKILFDIKRVLFFFYNPEKKGLIAKAVKGDEDLSMIGNLTIPLQVEESLLVQSLNKGRPLESFSRPTDDKLIILDEQLIRFLGKEGMLCLPMLAHGEYVGVIVTGLDQAEFSHLSRYFNILNMFTNNVALTLHANQVRRSQLSRIQSERLAASLSMARRVVHEVNNPLGIMKNYLKVLGRKLSPQDPAQEEIKILNEEIDRIAAILRSLTTFSEEKVYRLIPVDINALLSDIVRIMEGFLSEHSNIEVHLDLNRDGNPMVMAEKDGLRQVFINLIKNAAEAMSDGGNLYIKSRHISKHLEGRKCQGYVQVSITDEGPGISDEIKPRLFRPFTTSKGQGHSGLGLSTAYEIIKALNGTLTYKSEKGKGTTFEIELLSASRQGD